MPELNILWLDFPLCCASWTYYGSTFHFKYLIVADRLENLLDLEKDFQLKGDSVWKSFNAGKEKQKWYNVSIIENMYADLADEDIPGYFLEYEETVRRVFG